MDKEKFLNIVDDSFSEHDLVIAGLASLAINIPAEGADSAKMPEDILGEGVALD